jgi:uncharacterized LabA/DUF88 family protein
MTDVNIAVQLMGDAFDDAFDVALVVSGDSDLTTPIRRVRERFADKRVIVAFPPRRHSAELKRGTRLSRHWRRQASCEPASRPAHEA